MADFKNLEIIAGGDQSNRFTPKELLVKYLAFLPLFIISIILCLAIATIYTRYITPKYVANTLMYIKEEVKQVLPTKKLYAMGQYSKFVRPGSIRIEETIDGDSLPCSSYTYNDTIVSVLINESEEAYHIALPGYAVLEMIITDEHRDLQSIPFTGVIPPRSISTIRLKEE